MKHIFLRSGACWHYTVPYTFAGGNEDTIIDCVSVCVRYEARWQDATGWMLGLEAPSSKKVLIVGFTWMPAQQQQIRLSAVSIHKAPMIYTHVDTYHLRTPIQD
jgi:uncharacterized protein YgiM (DUF1202 family)